MEGRVTGLGSFVWEPLQGPRVPGFLLLELRGCPQCCPRQQQLQSPFLLLLLLFWANNPFGQLFIDAFLHPHPSSKLVIEIFSFLSTNSCLTFSHPILAWGVLTKNCGIWFSYPIFSLFQEELWLVFIHGIPALTMALTCPWGPSPVCFRSIPVAFLPSL